MTYFFAFSVAGLLLAGFGLLAFRFARVLCLHVLIFWVYFVALPLASAWLYTGRISRARHDRPGPRLRRARRRVRRPRPPLSPLRARRALRRLSLSPTPALADVRATLAAQRYSVVWPALFRRRDRGADALKLRYGLLLSGSGTAERIGEQTYLASSTMMVLGSVSFALFCYLALLSARTRLMLVPCLAYLPYVLATEGRRETLTALIVLFALRSFSLGFKPSWRLAAIAGGALLVFIVIGPFFMDARANWIFLQHIGNADLPGARREREPRARHDVLRGGALRAGGGQRRGARQCRRVPAHRRLASRRAAARRDDLGLDPVGDPFGLHRQAGAPGGSDDPASREPAHHRRREFHSARALCRFRRARNALRRRLHGALPLRPRQAFRARAAVRLLRGGGAWHLPLALLLDRDGVFGRARGSALRGALRTRGAALALPGAGKEKAA